MPTKITTIGAVPAETTGTDVANAGPVTPAIYDQNIANLRAAVDRALVALGGITSSNVLSGVWSPAFSGLANCSGVTKQTAIYTRVGGVVNYSIRVTLTVTAAGNILFNSSLPVASSASYLTDGGVGIAHAHDTTGGGKVVGYCILDAGALQASVTALSGGTHYVHIVGSYAIT